MHFAGSLLARCDDGVSFFFVKPFWRSNPKNRMVSVLEPQKKMGACDPKSRIFWDMFVESMAGIFSSNRGWKIHQFRGVVTTISWGWEVNEVNQDLIYPTW